MTALDTQHPNRSPRPPKATRPIDSPHLDVVVTIVDRTGQTRGIESLLPRRWGARRHQTIYEVDRPDLLVLGAATPFLVAASRLLHSQATIVAVIDADAAPRLLVDLLHSGADVCVREGALPILAAHLIASHRRRARGSRFAR